MPYIVEIESAVKELLAKKGNVITISLIDIYNCCVAVEEVDVRFKPPKTKDFDHIEQDGVSVYIQKGIRFKDNKVKLGYEFGPFKSVHVGGVRQFN